MKTTRLNNIIRFTFFGVMTAVMLFPFSAYAQKMIFLPSSVVPAAEGYTHIKNDKNKNYVIQVNISNLAEVSRLQPSKLTYVVWMETDQNKTENIGQLKSSTGFMSKAMKASFETVSSSRPTKVFITAENDGSIQYPGDQIVLSTSEF